MKKILILALCLNTIIFVANAEEDNKNENKSIDNKEIIKTYAGAHFVYLPTMKISIDDAMEKSNAYGFDMAVGIKKEKLRGEIEFKYISGWQAKDYASTSNIVEKESTDVSNMSIMTNLYIDILVANNDKLEPFIMAGIGISKTNIKGIYEETGYAVDSYNPCAGIPVSLCTSYNVYTYDYFDDNYEYKSNPLLFAYQLGMGFSYKLANNVVLDCMYRYFSTIKKDIDIKISDSNTDITTHSEFKLSAHEFLVGGRYMF